MASAPRAWSAANRNWHCSMIVEQSKNGEGQVVAPGQGARPQVPSCSGAVGSASGTSTASTCVCNAPHSTSTAPCGRWLNTWSVLPGWTGMYRARPAGAASRPCSFRWSPSRSGPATVGWNDPASREMRAIPFSALRRSRKKRRIFGMLIGHFQALAREKRRPDGSRRRSVVGSDNPTAFRFGRRERRSTACVADCGCSAGRPPFVGRARHVIDVELARWWAG